MDASYDSHHEGGFWSLTNLIGLILGLLVLVGASSLCYRGLHDFLDPGDKPVDVSAYLVPAATGPGAETLVTIKPSTANPLAYDTASFEVKSGTKVKVTFNNQSILPQPHNLIICKPGTKDKVLGLAMAMLTDPNGLAKGYIPESPDILWHTKLIMPGTSESLEFVAPAPGDYSYFCSFPGHAIIMNGIMKVR